MLLQIAYWKLANTKENSDQTFLYTKCDRHFNGNSAVMWCGKCKNAYCLACTIVHEAWQELRLQNKVITAGRVLASPK